MLKYVIMLMWLHIWLHILRPSDLMQCGHMLTYICVVINKDKWELLHYAWTRGKYLKIFAKSSVRFDLTSLFLCSESESKEVKRRRGEIICLLLIFSLCFCFTFSYSLTKYKRKKKYQTWSTEQGKCMPLGMGNSWHRVIYYFPLHLQNHVIVCCYEDHASYV